MAGSEEYICIYCGARLKTRTGLNRHVRTHENDAPYRCCGKKFFDSTTLRMHRCSVHGRQEEEACEICSKKFATQQQVGQHTALVHCQTFFKCEICGLEFKSKRSLTDYMSKHNGQKAYMCQCGKAYQYAKPASKHAWDKHVQNEYPW